MCSQSQNVDFDTNFNISITFSTVSLPKSKVNFPFSVREREREKETQIETLTSLIQKWTFLAQFHFTKTIERFCLSSSIKPNQMSKPQCLEMKLSFSSQYKL